MRHALFLLLLLFLVPAPRPAPRSPAAPFRAPYANAESSLRLPACQLQRGLEPHARGTVVVACHPGGPAAAGLGGIQAGGRGASKDGLLTRKAAAPSLRQFAESCREEAAYAAVRGPRLPLLA